MNLVCGDHRSPEQRESYVSESALLCSSGGPVFTLHHTVVRRRAAKRDAIPLIVSAHARKGAAASDAAFEMVDMRRFEVWARGLIVTAVFVQPGNWIRISAAICSHRLLVMSTHDSQEDL